jgi:hypothetical protein
MIFPSLSFGKNSGRSFLSSLQNVTREHGLVAQTTANKAGRTRDRSWSVAAVAMMNFMCFVFVDAIATRVCVAGKSE